MIKLKGILKFTWRHGGNIVSDGYWDTENSVYISETETRVRELQGVSFCPKNL